MESGMVDGGGHVTRTVVQKNHNSVTLRSEYRKEKGSEWKASSKFDCSRR